MTPSGSSDDAGSATCRARSCSSQSDAGTSPNPHSHPQSPSPPDSTAVKWATAADWEHHRATITDLYRDRGMRLEEVVKKMAREHSFHANPRMYKTRIKKWGIDKNQKAAEVAHLLRLKRQRDEQGKASEFIVRGRVVDWSKVEQYLRRDPALVRKLDAPDGRSPPRLSIGRATGIIARTPPPDPAGAFSVPPSPSPSAYEAQLPDDIARLTRDYFLGAVGPGGVWCRRDHYEGGGGACWSSRHGGIPATLRLREWEMRMRSARQLVAVGAHAEGFALLGRCLDDMASVVRDQDPSLLTHLIGHTLGMTPAGREVGVALGRHIAALTRIVLGARHPLTLIFARLITTIGTDAHFGSIPVPATVLMQLFGEDEGQMTAEYRDMYERFVALLRRPPSLPPPQLLPVVKEEGSYGPIPPPPRDPWASVQEMIDLVDDSPNLAVRMRFSSAYLTYLAEMHRVRGRQGKPERESSSEDGIESSPSPPPPRKMVIRLRDVKNMYWFDAGVVGALKKPEDPKDILWELTNDGNERVVGGQDVTIPRFDAPEIEM